MIDESCGDWREIREDGQGLGDRYVGTFTGVREYVWVFLQSKGCVLGVGGVGMG